ncbi:glyoxal oxidase [Meredithblackwellia eburnea MCA 4105]
MVALTLFATALISSSVAIAGKANTFAIVGETGASAQQLFLGTENKIYIVDKTQNNPATINGHPAWATEYDLTTNTYRALDIITNSFCAGGTYMGNGSVLNVGGNNAITTLGVSLSDLKIAEGGGAYKDYSGGRATRVLTPCDNSTCDWTEDVDGIPKNRWYPTLETLEDGSAIIIGGELWGGFVNSPDQMQSVPSYEFWPTRGDPIISPFLEDTQPANLYPLTWLLSNGLIFMQADWQTTLVNYTSNVEKRLPNITHAQRTYPASGATSMLPLTVRDNYAQTILFCGGMKPQRDDWDNKKWAIVNTNTSSSCVSIQPLNKSPQWVDEDDLPENRGMGNFIILPDERLFLANGVGRGSAGYGYDSWAVNQSYADDPVHRPAYYNHSAPAGQRWDTNLPSSNISRMYHSTASLLPDGSIFIAGSSPSADVINEQTNATYKYYTEYRAEVFYPDYYDKTRPDVSGIPSSISYGGSYFDVNLTASSVAGADLSTLKVNLIRTGFSTHAMNMGMKYIELNSTYTVGSDGSVTVHVSQLPPNPALFVPGNALFFVVVGGVPSVAKFVMAGSGEIETQPILAASTLPASSGKLSTSGKSSSSNSSDSQSSGAGSSGYTSLSGLVALVAGSMFLHFLVEM